MNHVLLVALVGWFSAQFIKILLELYKTKKININLIMASGGMPSSHSSLAVSTATAIGFQEGFDTAVFALAVVLSCIVMYDASGVRHAAGKQAKVINNIVAKIEDTGFVMDEKLKEILGHTHIEVLAGAILGIVVGYLMR